MSQPPDGGRSDSSLVHLRVATVSAVRLLVVEHEAKMANLLSRGLQEEGYAVDVAGPGEDTLWMTGAAAYDAIILDVMPPSLGLQTCAKLREQDVWTPVLILTDGDAVDDGVASLDADADDHLAKPFSFSELLARLGALTPRAPESLDDDREDDDQRHAGECRRARGPDTGR